jgi:hypothetical protein
LEYLPWWGTVLILASCLAVIWLSAVLPKWRARRRAAALERRHNEAKQLLAESEEHRVFRIGPIPAPLNDEPITFARADGRHEEILQWITDSQLPLLYVTGHSGSGKSSLMQAYVVPMLQSCNFGDEEPQTAAFLVRAFGDIDQTIVEAATGKKVVWIAPPNLGGLKAREVLEKAGEYVYARRRRLVIVFDQFEEVIVGVEPAEQPNIPVVALIRSLQERPIRSVCLVLVARAEYGDVFVALGLPGRDEGRTWQDVPAFSLSDAAKFLVARLPHSGSRKAEAEVLAMTLAREAESVVDLPGRVTPIALNMIGQMYTEDPVLGAQLAQPDVNAAEGVLFAYVRGRVVAGDLREAGPKLLDQLVTHKGRREQPVGIGKLADDAGLAQGAVETALLTLARHGLVRRAGERWEVAHDFLAPLLRGVLDRILSSIGRQLRPWLPAVLAGILGLMAAGLWGLGQHRIATEIRDYNETFEFDHENWTVKLLKNPTREAVRYLASQPDDWTRQVRKEDQSEDDAVDSFRNQNVRVIRSVEFSRVYSNFEIDLWVRRWLGQDSGLTGLHKLDFSGRSVPGVALPPRLFGTQIPRDLKQEAFLASLYTGSRLTDVGVKEIARRNSGLTELTTLNLSFTKVTDAGLTELARPDSGLTALMELDLAGTQVTDAGLKELARPDSGLAGLIELDLAGTQITDAGLKELARPDSGLRRLTVLRVTCPVVLALQKARPRLRVFGKDTVPR